MRDISPKHSPGPNCAILALLPVSSCKKTLTVPEAMMYNSPCHTPLSNIRVPLAYVAGWSRTRICAVSSGCKLRNSELASMSLSGSRCCMR